MPASESDHTPLNRVRPGDFARILLAASGSPPRARARDQQADVAGEALRQRVLNRLIVLDPDPEELEAALLAVIIEFGEPAGPTRGVCRPSTRSGRWLASSPITGASWSARRSSPSKRLLVFDSTEPPNQARRSNIPLHVSPTSKPTIDLFAPYTMTDGLLDGLSEDEANPKGDRSVQRSPSAPSSLEHDRAVSIHQYSILQVPTHGLSQHSPLHLPADTNHIVHAVTVGDMGYVLVDDRPAIEFRRDVMGRGPDDLHSSGVCLVVRASSHEGWQERVMDVDDRLVVGTYKLGREDLHVAGKHHQVDLMLPQQRLNPRLLLGLRFRGHGQVEEGDAMGLDLGGEVVMVGDHQWDLGVQLARLPSPEHVDQAMPLLRDHDGHALGSVGEANPPSHPVLAGQRGEGGIELVPAQAEATALDLHPHEEGAAGCIADMLVGAEGYCRCAGR